MQDKYMCLGGYFPNLRSLREYNQDILHIDINDTKVFGFYTVH